jgi:hypothetical protein
VTWRAGGDGRSIQIPAEVWERVFGRRPKQVNQFTHAPDYETVDILSGDEVLETTTVGDLRRRGVL